jgi:hypothetical protein
MSVMTSRTQQLVATGVVVLGVGLGAAGIASAASGGTTTTTTLAASGSTITGSMDPATMTHGAGEALLTGTDLADATAAATAAVPGANVIRAETDAAGSAFEVHLRKADGSDVTVKLDSSFKVTAIEDGFCAGPAGSTGSTPT